MGYIDVAIPGIIGLLCLAAPSVLVKPSDDPAADARKTRTIRICGGGLLVVAGLYLVIKLAGGAGK